MRPGAGYINMNIAPAIAAILRRAPRELHKREALIELRVARSGSSCWENSVAQRLGVSRFWTVREANALRQMNMVAARTRRIRPK